MSNVVKCYGEFHVEIEHDSRIRAQLTRTDGAPSPPALGRVSEEPLLLENIHRALTKLKDGKLNEAEDLRRFGQELYAAVLPGEVGALLRHAVQDVHQENFRTRRDLQWQLRVIVEVDPESKVFDWPLELLYYDDKKYSGWLATEDLPIMFSRRTQIIGRDAPPPEGLPLRVLVVVSNPLGGGTSDEVLKEMAALVSAAAGRGWTEKKLEVRVLADEEAAGLAEGIDYAGQPEWSRIYALGEHEEWQPHVLHFIGHGRHEERPRKGWLALVKGHEVDWCSAGDLIRALRKWTLRVVVLQACENAQSGTEPAFVNLVDDLARADIPAVVATQLSITNRSAIEFAKGFYKALLEGSDVDQAVQRGRREIYRQSRSSSPAFGTPVLFTYGPGRIIEPVRIVPRPRPAEARERDWRAAASELEDLMALVTHRDFTWETDEEILVISLEEIGQRMGQDTLEWNAVQQGVKRIREGRIRAGLERLDFVRKRIQRVRDEDKRTGPKLREQAQGARMGLERTPAPLQTGEHHKNPSSAGAEGDAQTVAGTG